MSQSYNCFISLRTGARLPPWKSYPFSHVILCHAMSMSDTFVWRSSLACALEVDWNLTLCVGLLPLQISLCCILNQWGLSPFPRCPPFLSLQIQHRWSHYHYCQIVYIWFCINFLVLGVVRCYSLIRLHCHLLDIDPLHGQSLLNCFDLPLLHSLAHSLVHSSSFHFFFSYYMVDVNVVFVFVINIFYYYYYVYYCDHSSLIRM